MSYVIRSDNYQYDRTSNALGLRCSRLSTSRAVRAASLLILLSLFAVVLAVPVVRAQSWSWTISTNFDQESYTLGSSGKVSLSLTNTGADNLLITDIGIQFDWQQSANSWNHMNVNTEIDSGQSENVATVKFVVPADISSGTHKYRVGVYQSHLESYYDPYTDLYYTSWVEDGAEWGSTWSDIQIVAVTTTIVNSPQSASALLRNGVAQTTVNFTEGYANLPSGDIVFAGVRDVNSKGVATGSASSTPDQCLSLTGTSYANDAMCLMNPALGTGTEYITFTLTFTSTQQYNLAVVTGAEDQSGNTISGSTSTSPTFTISVTDKLQLTLTLPGSVAAAVDGVAQTAGNVDMLLKLGQHTISVPQTVPLTSGSQLRFDHWSDGSKTANRTDDLEDNTKLAATYVTQYSLSLTDPSASGAGWYDQGTTAQFSAPPSEPVPGIMGMLGATQNFQGWYENGASITSSNSGSITMNAPHTLTPQRTENDTMPIAIIAIIVVAVAVIGFAALRRRKKTVPAQRAVSPAIPAGAKFCASCGAQNKPGTKFCEKCGASVAGNGV